MYNNIENPDFDKALLALDSVVYTKSPIVAKYPAGDQQKYWWAIPQGLNWEIHSEEVIARKNHCDPLHDLHHMDVYNKEVETVIPKYHGLVSKGLIPVVWVHEAHPHKSVYHLGQISIFSQDLATMAPIYAFWSFQKDESVVGLKLNHKGTSVYEFSDQSIAVANGFFVC